MALHGPARWRPIRLFVVHERSMLPGLAPGQGLVTVRWPRRRAGQIRVTHHPIDSDMWIVKRLRSQQLDGRWHLDADNPAEGLGSERFGPVDLGDSWLVVWAVPKRWMTGRRH